MGGSNSIRVDSILSPKGSTSDDVYLFVLLCD